MMLIHIGDQRTHSFPEDWHPVNEDYYQDVEVWICERYDE